MEYSELIKKAVQWAEKQGIKSIKANVENYEQPTKYSKQGEAEPFIPDLTGLQLAKKIYVEIALKEENIQRKISKWKLLSTLAGMKGGKLFLLAPKGHKAFAEKIVEKYHLEAKVVYLRT